MSFLYETIIASFYQFVKSVNSSMNGNKTRQQQKLDDINELLGYILKETKGETVAAQLGYMMGWMSRVASQDSIVGQELDARLKQARRKYSSSKDTLSPRRPRP